MNSTCSPSPGVFGTCLTRLTGHQLLGLMVELETGAISALAVVIFLCLVARNVIRHYRDPPPGEWSLLRTHVDVYFLCLLVFELIHGIANMMSIRWLRDGELKCGLHCTIQGAMKNIGSAGVALVTLVIAIHTFAVILFLWIPPRSILLPISIVFVIWAFLITYVSYELSLPRAPDAPYYGPTPYWCWIGPSHRSERIWGQYFWIWFSAFSSILLYVPLYFCVKGNLTYRPCARWKIRITRTVPVIGGCTPLQSLAAKAATRDAMCMLYYPVAYVLLVLPLSIVRFMSETWEDKGKHFPFAATAVGGALFGLSGALNVVLFVTTRPNLLLFRSDPPPPPPPHCRTASGGLGFRKEDEGGGQQGGAFFPPPPSSYPHPFSVFQSPVEQLHNIPRLRNSSVWDLRR